MNNRMEKYEGASTVSERTARNKKLYEEVTEMSIDFIDDKADIDTNSIELNNNTRPKTRSDYQKLRSFDDILPNRKVEDKITIKEEDKERVYDINEILKLARDNKLFDTQERKRLINTEYNILAKLNLEELDDKEILSKEALRELIDKIYSNESPKKKRRISEKELFSDLVSDNPSEEILSRTDEKAKTDLLLDIAVDKTNEMEITEENPTITITTVIDENAVNKDEKYDEEELFEDKSRIGIIILIIVIIALLAAGGYFLYQYLMH